MPQIKFTDSTLSKLSADQTTSFTDPTVKGLRLCVTKDCVKTWCVSKWDTAAQKTRAVELAQWASKGTHCRCAKDQLGKVVFDIHEGNVHTRKEAEAEKIRRGIPTFLQALEQYIEHRTSQRASGKHPMTHKTATDYRNTFNRHLAHWADVDVDKLPILEVNQYLNAAQL